MKTEFARRQFLQRTAIAAGALLTPKGILLEQELPGNTGKPVPPSDRVRFGMIGIATLALLGFDRLNQALA